MISPLEAYYGTISEGETLTTFHPDYICMSRGRKSQPRAVERYHVSGGPSQFSNCLRVLKASTCRICYSRNMTWVYPRTPLVKPPPTTSEVGGVYAHVMTHEVEGYTCRPHQYLEAVGGLVEFTVEVPLVACHCLRLRLLVAIHLHVGMLGKKRVLSSLASLHTMPRAAIM